jgi:hypothetical protein
MTKITTAKKTMVRKAIRATSTLLQTIASR